MHFGGEAALPLQGLPYTPYAPPSGGLSIPLPLPASPRHLIPCKGGTGRGAPPVGSEGGGPPRPRSAPRATSTVAEYIRRSLCDPHTPRAPSPTISRGGPLAATKGGPSRGPSPQRAATAPLTSVVKSRATGLQASPLQPTAQRALSRQQQQQQQQQQPQRRATLPGTRLSGRQVSPSPSKGASGAPLPGPFQGLPTVEALTAALTRNQQELAKLNTNLRQQQQQQQQQRQQQQRVSLPDAPVSRQQGVEGPSSRLRAQGVLRGPPQGAPCRRARSEEARPTLRAPSLQKPKVSGAPAGAPRAAATAAATTKRSLRSPRGGAPRGPLWGPLDEISEGERSRFMRALEEVERQFAEKLAECATALPKEMASKVYAASSVDGKLQELRGALVHLTQQAGEGKAFGDSRGDASQLHAARKREALLQTVRPSCRDPSIKRTAASRSSTTQRSSSSSSKNNSSKSSSSALTEARANLTAARDQVSRLRRLILPLQHGVAAFAAVQRRDAAAQGAPYHPFTPYTPAAAPQGGPEGPLCAQELGDFKGRLFDDPGREGGPLIPSLSDVYAPTPGGPPPSSSDEGPHGPLHVRRGPPEELPQDGGKRPPTDSPYLLEEGPPLLRSSSFSMGREPHGGAPLERGRVRAPQTQRPPPDEEDGDSFLRGDSRGTRLNAHEGGPPSLPSLEREAPSRGLFSLSSGKPSKPPCTRTSLNYPRNVLSCSTPPSD
ncbi:hypothetical protein Emed_001871 [Eimeria media]